MTKASKELLDGWKEKCPETLLGCESAAAEPYIEELRLSDNRYELCYTYGRPIPVYDYLYHPYLKNFMGNQVSCPLAYTTELCELRLSYSFLAGDLLTLVLNDEDAGQGRADRVHSVAPELAQGISEHFPRRRNGEAA